MAEIGYPDYRENNYGKSARFTDENYRADLLSWQIPAIKEHFGSLAGKTFIDIGAGDIVLGERVHEIGVPKKFYVQDLSEPSLRAGLDRIAASGVDVGIFQAMVSDHFNFDCIRDGELDAAFSNSLFSHLTLNSILACLRNLFPKLKPGGSYLTSMIVLPGTRELYRYDWGYLQEPRADIVSFSMKDPFHYTEKTIRNLGILGPGFEVRAVHDYGHPFQKLVEFYRP